MKKFAFLFIIVLVLLASCSQMETEKDNASSAVQGTTIKISGKQILSKAFADNKTQSNKNARNATDAIPVFDITLSLEGGEKTETQNASGTEEEINSTTFYFEKIPVGTTVTVLCKITLDGYTFWEGTSAPITITSGENYASITLKRPTIKIESFSFRYESARIASKTKNGSFDINEILELVPALANEKITWSSSDTSIATVDENGIVTAVVASNAGDAFSGKTTITAKVGEQTKSFDLFVCDSDAFTKNESEAIINATERTNLKAYSIPYGFTTIGDDDLPDDDQFVFNQTTFTNLESIIIPSSVTKIASLAFSSGLSRETTNKLKYVTIDSPELEIGDATFRNCKNLEPLKFTKDVKNIRITGTSAFSYSGVLNNSFNNLVIPECVTELSGSQIFFACNIETVTFPKSLKKIGAVMWEFDPSDSGYKRMWPQKTVFLKEATFLGPPPEYVGDAANDISSIFKACGSLETIYVPAEYFEQYKADFLPSGDPELWKKIVAIPE